MIFFGFTFLILFVFAVLGALMVASDLKTHGHLFSDKEKFLGVCICLFEFIVASNCVLCAYKIFTGMMS